MQQTKWALLTSGNAEYSECRPESKYMYDCRVCFLLEFFEFFESRNEERVRDPPGIRLLSTGNLVPRMRVD